MYFRLNPECYFIKGYNNAAIYDIITCKIYSLSKIETELLEQCEKNEPLDDKLDFLEELKKLCLGDFYHKKKYIHKLKASPLFTNEEIRNPPPFYRAFLEINNECHIECDLCELNRINRLKGCMGCNIWDENSESLPLHLWKKLILEIGRLGCQDVFIKGGDITLDWKKTMEIVNIACQEISNVYVILHSKTVTKSIIQNLEDKAKIIIQTDDIKNIDLNYINILTLRPDKWNTPIESHKNLIIDHVMVTSNTTMNLPQKTFPSKNVFEFLNNMEFHPCLGHTLTICFDGKVLSCPMMRDHIFGNIKNSSISIIFKEKMDEINKLWKLNLNKIDKCNKCEFRYACDDCRAIEESLTKKLSGKKLCVYDPKKGEWKNKRIIL